MIEIELVSSWMAVRHIVEENRGLYGGDKRGKNIQAILLKASIVSSSELYENHGLLSGDTYIRAKDVASRLQKSADSDSPRSLWDSVQKLVNERISRMFGSNPSSVWSRELVTAVDPDFFIIPQMGHIQDGLLQIEGDGHFHVGGAVPWDAVWQRQMLEHLPLAFLNQVNWRLFPKKHASRLVDRARKARKHLFAATGLSGLREEDPGADRLLFERIRRAGKCADDDIWEDLRDYVSIRGLFRREMLAAHVTSLDEFTKDQWKRFWISTKSRAVPFSAALVRRALSVERWKFFQVRNILARHGVGRVSLRTNLKYFPGPIEAGNLREALNTVEELARNTNKNCKFGFVFHAGRPFSLSEKDQDNSVKQLKATQKFLTKILKDDPRKKWISYDLAGPERNCRNQTFISLIEAIYKDAKKQAPHFGVTIHAGEDFYDPLNGLWRIWNLWKIAERYKMVTRIGHASILGINPYMLKWRDYYCPWIARKDGIDGAMEMAKDLSVNMPVCLEKEYEKKSLGTVDLDCNVHINPDREEIKFFFDLQKAIFSKLAQSNAIIESNPTSNVAVLGLSGFELSPFWGLFAQAQHYNGNSARIILGTDDPGLCCTSIDEEYHRLASAYNLRIKLEEIESKKKDAGERLLPSHLMIGNTPWKYIEHKTRQLTRRFAVVEYEHLGP